MRPEMKVERVSYDVITPSARAGHPGGDSLEARNPLGSGQPAVLEPIRFESIRRNEVGGKLSTTRVGQAIRVGRPDELVKLYRG